MAECKDLVVNESELDFTGSHLPDLSGVTFPDGLKVSSMDATLVFDPFRLPNHCRLCTMLCAVAGPGPHNQPLTGIGTSPARIDRCIG